MTLKERLEQYQYIEPKITANYFQIQTIRNHKVDSGSVKASMPVSPWIQTTVSENGLSISQRAQIKVLNEENQSLMKEAVELREIIENEAREYDPVVSLALYWKYLSGEGMTWEDVAGKINYTKNANSLEKTVGRFFTHMSGMSAMSETRAV